MYYKATDRWNDDHLEHRNHKYYIKVGDGPNARYFYSAQEYAAYQKGSRQGASKNIPMNNKGIVNKIRNNINAERARNQGDQQMRALRQNQARRLNGQDRASASKGDSRTTRNDAASTRGHERMAAKTNRRQAMQDAYNSRRTESERRAAAYQRKQIETNRSKMAEKRQRADRLRKAQKATHDMNYEAKSNKPIIQREVDLGGGRKIKKTILGTRDIKRAGIRAKAAASKTYGNAKRAASKAYKSAKKAYNSKQSKTFRSNAKKKARTTAKRAYNSGRSFVKNLFKKRK